MLFETSEIPKSGYSVFFQAFAISAFQCRIRNERQGIRSDHVSRHELVGRNDEL